MNTQNRNPLKIFVDLEAAPLQGDASARHPIKETKYVHPQPPRS